MTTLITLALLIGYGICGVQVFRWFGWANEKNMLARDHEYKLSCKKCVCSVCGRTASVHLHLRTCYDNKWVSSGSTHDSTYAAGIPIALIWPVTGPFVYFIVRGMSLQAANFFTPPGPMGKEIRLRNKEIKFDEEINRLEMENGILK